MYYIQIVNGYIDVENGYMDCFVDFCKKVRLLYPDKIIVAGNVVTAEMVNKLVSKGGVDVVKVGMSSGTYWRRQIGVGRSQLHAIKDCSEMCRKLRSVGYEAYIVSDGGIKYPCDIAKSFGAGADFVVADGLFSEIKTSQHNLTFPLELTIHEMLSNLRSACYYIGAKCIEKIPERTLFVPV